MLIDNILPAIRENGQRVQEKPFIFKRIYAKHHILDNDPLFREIAS
jgi:hypothetical protein